MSPRLPEYGAGNPQGEHPLCGGFEGQRLAVTQTPSVFADSRAVEPQPRGGATSSDMRHDMIMTGLLAFVLGFALTGMWLTFLDAMR
jgi:hypothetical protein